MVSRDDFLKFAVDEAVRNLPLEKRLRLLSEDHFHYNNSVYGTDYLVCHANLKGTFVKHIDEKRTINLDLIEPGENYKGVDAPCLFVANKYDEERIKNTKNKYFYQSQLFFTTSGHDYGIYSRLVRFSYSGFDEFIKGRKIKSSFSSILYLRSLFDEQKFFYDLVRINLTHILDEELASIKKNFNSAYLSSDNDLEKNKEEFGKQFDFKLISHSSNITLIILTTLKNLNYNPISGDWHAYL